MATVTTNNQQKTTTNNLNNEVQKFKAITEKLRLEIKQLHGDLQNEKHAVRMLKSQHEQQVRKHKSELSEREQSFKKQLNEKLTCSKILKNQKLNGDSSRSDNISDHASTNCENCRTLRDSHKDIEEKLHKLIEADRLKAADLRAQHDSHLIETQKLQRSNRIETQRLLEEIKTKDRIIDHLRHNIRNNGASSTKNQTQSTESMRKLVKELPPPPPPPLTPLPPDDNDPTQTKNEITKPPESPVVNMASSAVVTKESKSCNLSTINKSVSEPRAIITEVATVANNGSDYCHTITPTVSALSKNSSNELIKTNSSIMPPAANERLAFGVNSGDNSTDFQKQIHNTSCQLRQDESTPTTITNNDQNRIDQPLSNKHRKEAYYRSLINCDAVEEDTDSAVSSAPSSLSPQPYHPISSLVPNFDTYNTNSTVETPNKLVNPPSLVFHENIQFHNYQNYTKSPTTPVQSPWFHPDHNSNQNENILNGCLGQDDLQSELAIAKRQVRELERALLVTREVKITPNSSHIIKQNEVVQMGERIRRLEAREVALLGEIQDLREQNELQEFRILELEECHEKWSLRSQSSSELRDIESSRVTPLPPQDTNNTMLDYKGDIVREHLMVMLKKASEAEDKHCLQQVLTLLDNLETLSQEHVHCLDDYSGEFYSKQYITNSTPMKMLPSTPTPTMIHLIEDDKTPFKKKQLSNASSLQESGIFEGDSLETYTIGTQTESGRNDIKLSELTAEIQKLNQIRESIEGKNKNTQNCIDSNTKLKLLRELEYYKNRMELLEQKIQVYESPKDLQIREFQKHLNNEMFLIQQVKELRSEILKLKAINMELEEVKCEFEEAENDTRLYSQQLEFDLRLQLERLQDLEETFRVNKRKIKDLKQQQIYWERLYDERNFEFEERESDCQAKIELLQNLIPILILFNVYNQIKILFKQSICAKKIDIGIDCNIVTSDKSVQIEDNFETEFNRALKENEKLIKTVKSLEDNYKSLLNKTDVEMPEPVVVYDHKLNTLTAIEKEFNQALKEKDKLIKTIKRLEDNYTNLLSKKSRKVNTPDYYQQKMVELLENNKELKKQLELLEQREIAYIETLQQADNIWAEMEAGYKKRINDAEDSESQLRIQLQKLEENDHKLRKSIIQLNERIIELEDSEKKLEDRCNLYERDNKYLHKDNQQLNEELNCAKLEWRNIKDNLEGSLHMEMDRLRKKIRQFQEEIDISTKVLEDTEELHQKDISVLKMQLNKTNKELVHLDIANSELREEMTQQETRISELQTALLEQRIVSERTIKSLTSELAQFSDLRQQFLFRNKRSFSYSGLQQQPMSLREELRASQSAGNSPTSITQEINDDGLKIN